MNRKFFSPYFSNRSGATAVLFALLLPLLLIAVGVGVDLGRLHLAQSRAQNALDSGLLGAATTAAQRPVKEEAQALFNANYPVDYQGTQLTGFEVTQEQQAGGATAWNGTASLTVPMTFMRLAGKNTLDFTVRSQVTLFPQQVASEEVELALVLDNTGSMSYGVSGGGNRIQALKAASADLLNILFGASVANDRLHVSVIPYDSTVNIGPNRGAWVRENFRGNYLGVSKKCFSSSNPASLGANCGSGIYPYHVANRDYDYFRENNPNEYTDAPPSSDDPSTLFRTNRGDFAVPKALQVETIPNGSGNGSLKDQTSRKVQLLFASSQKATILNTINAMAPGNITRINVGLMWGWYTLSPLWQGLWDDSRPHLPLSRQPHRQKWLVLMTDGENASYLGEHTSLSNDNTSTAALCTAIKQQGITIYTVGLTDSSHSNFNEPLLRNCASLPEYYFLADDDISLRNAFSAIGEQVVRKAAMRLTR